VECCFFRPFSCAVSLGRRVGRMEKARERKEGHTNPAPRVSRAVFFSPRPRGDGVSRQADTAGERRTACGRQEVGLERSQSSSFHGVIERETCCSSGCVGGRGSNGRRDRSTTATLGLRARDPCSLGAPLSAFGLFCLDNGSNPLLFPRKFSTLPGLNRRRVGALELCSSLVDITPS